MADKATGPARPSLGGGGSLTVFLVCAAFVARASAQTIAPAEYLPLGADPQWLFERTAGSGPDQVRGDIVEVKQADSGIRYLLEIPLKGLTTHVRIELATKAVSTSAADFTIKTFKPRFFKREIPKSNVTDLVVDVVSPSSAP